VDAQIQRALCSFYREEFERHIEHLLASGLLCDDTRASVDPVCRRFLSGLDRLCWRSDFPVVAEALLRNFDALTQLSSTDTHESH
jgi:hypothetical protein